MKTLINCSEECTGCLVGERKRDLIDFKCNKCGKKAGYITLKELNNK